MANYRVFKSDRGEFFIDPVDDSNDFIASFDGSKWSEGMHFDAYAAEELLLVIDPKEAQSIVDSARKQLRRDSVVA